MQAIKDVIINVIQDLETKKTTTCGTDPQILLRKVLTKKEREHIKFKYFKKGILGLSVDSSAWLYKINLQKEELLEKLSKKINTLKEIRLRIGAIK